MTGRGHSRVRLPHFYVLHELLCRGAFFLGAGRSHRNSRVGVGLGDHKGLGPMMLRKVAQLRLFAPVTIGTLLGLPQDFNHEAGVECAFFFKTCLTFLLVDPADTLDVRGLHVGNILPNLLVKTISGPHETLAEHRLPGQGHRSKKLKELGFYELALPGNTPA